MMCTSFEVQKQIDLKSADDTPHCNIPACDSGCEHYSQIPNFYGT